MHSTLIGIGSIIGRSSIGYDLPAIKPQICRPCVTASRWPGARSRASAPPCPSGSGRSTGFSSRSSWC
jgi:hypothetical protein